VLCFSVLFLLCFCLRPVSNVASVSGLFILDWTLRVSLTFI
jgi:hypothetical protein